MYVSCLTLFWNSSWSLFGGFAYFFHGHHVPDLNTFDGLWTFSIYLEALGIIPQMYHLIQVTPSFFKKFSYLF